MEVVWWRQMSKKEHATLSRAPWLCTTCLLIWNKFIWNSYVESKSFITGKMPNASVHGGLGAASAPEVASASLQPAQPLRGVANQDPSVCCELNCALPQNDMLKS